ncbi:hypothetical protein [Clostridium brassicae]|uniref:Uncharacterized protein n=1 Tax=Clostridium brassicae TaxID=2999072 RepID=A0ABT4DAN0_9CLOT|nr:hypothetical protein [Clostridium brassicae]MCY6959364.1 hypothetical protein [Clostridium brassicae]
MIKRKMSLLLAAAIVATGVGMAKPAFADQAKTTLPAITYIAPQHTLATDNVPFTFALEAANYEGDVQYRIFVQKDGGAWTELTNGYTEAVNAKVPYIPSVAKNLEAGKYKASIWVKRAEVKEGANKNVTGSYDTYYVKNFSIGTAESLKERADLSGLGIKDTYKVGEKVTISGKEGYQYKLHIYDPSAPVRREGWTIDKTYETATDTSYTFTKPGKYLVDVWGMTSNPSEAIKTQGYDGWMLKVVTVEDKTTEEVTAKVEIKDAFDQFNKTVVVTLEGTDHPENYKVVSKVSGKELKYYETSKTFKEVVASTLAEEAAKAENYTIVNTKVDVPAVKDVKVTDAFDQFNKTVAVTLDTDKPENFKVVSKVSGKELKYYETSKTFKEVVASTLAEEAGKAENYTVEVK